MATTKEQRHGRRQAARSNPQANDQEQLNHALWEGAGRGLPPPPANLQTVGEFEDWLARQPLDVQDQYVNHPQFGDMSWIAIQEQRVEAFRNGEELPGMDATGGGIDREVLGDQAKADVLRGRNIESGRQTEQEFEELPRSAYEYTPETEQDVGYRPQDRYQYLDENFDPLELSLEEQAILQSRTDTTGIDAQKGVLGEYADLYAQGGLNAIDRARLEQARRTRAAQGRAAEEAIMADMEERGRAGSNAELLARMQGQQGATNARSMDDLQTMALGLQRRDALLRDQGTLGDQIQTAQDVIDQFNTLGERDRQSRNVDRANKGEEATWDERSRRESANKAQFNQGIDTGFGYDVGRERGRVGTINRASEFNVSPNQGQRGQIRDRMTAREVTMGPVGQAANIRDIRQQRRDEAEAAQEQALIEGVTGGVTTIASPFISKWAK